MRALIGPHLEEHRVLGYLFAFAFLRICMTKLVACVLAAVLLITCSPAVRATERATPDDTARFLAGLRPSPGSPLSTLTKSAVWQRHAARFDALFELKDRASLS